MARIKPDLMTMKMTTIVSNTKLMNGNTAVIAGKILSFAKK